jgi:hypothetical protein
VAVLTKIFRVAMTLLLAASVLSPAYGEDNVRLVEQEIKAGLLYNFLKYTQWPAEHANRGAVVCLIGGDSFGGHLQPMAGRTVNQHSIEIRNLETLQDVDACSLLYVHASEEPNWPRLLKALAGKDVLTVGDFDGFAERGGMIEFTRNDNRIGVKINVDAVTAAHLSVQSRLLRLASTVHSDAAD